MFSLPLSDWRNEIVGTAVIAVFLGTAGYLGHGWYAAAGERDTAITERKKAEGERDTALTKVGELQSVVSRQNLAVLKAAEATTRAGSLYTEAMKKSASYRDQVTSMMAQTGDTKSADCASALASQRRMIESLNKIRSGPQ